MTNFEAYLNAQDVIQRAAYAVAPDADAPYMQGLEPQEVEKMLQDGLAYAFGQSLEKPDWWLK